MKLLLDEMYPAALPDGLRVAGVEARTAAALKLTGSPDAELFAAAVAGGYVLVTENLGDFTRIAAEHSTLREHYPGVVIVLSSRFSRRPTGIPPLVAAIRNIVGEGLEDRVVNLERVPGT